MGNQKTLKAKEEKFKIEEIVAVASDRGMKTVNAAQVSKKISAALKNSTEYKYDEDKSLSENIYEAFPQYKLRELTKEFSEKMNSWGNPDIMFIDPASRVRFAAARLGIPRELSIAVKKSKEDANSKAKDASRQKNKYQIDKRTSALSYRGFIG